MVLRRVFEATRVLAAVLLPVFFAAVPSWAQGETEPATEEETQEAQWPPFDWQIGPTKLQVGTQGTLDLPAGYRALGPEHTRDFQRMMDNQTSLAEVLTIVPDDLAGQWFLLFSWEDCGYVSDDDREGLDADDILKACQENQKQANESRKANGQAPMFVVDWVVKPHYSEQTNRLESALLLEDEEGANWTNFKTELLGRYGKFQVTLVCDLNVLQSLRPTVRSLLNRFRFDSGSTYAEYQKGDKIAQYTLAGLAGGGAAAVLAKTGILKKFGKIIFGVIAAVGAAIVGFFKKMFGGGGGTRRGTRRSARGTRRNRMPRQDDFGPEDDDGPRDEIGPIGGGGRSGRVGRRRR